MTQPAGKAVILCVSFLSLAACQNKEQSYGAGGAALGALTCGLIGNAIFHSAVGTAGSAAACGAAGFLIGSAIGRDLDERDRNRAVAATQQALAVPVRATYSPTRANVVRPTVRPVAWSSDHGTGARGSADLVEVQPQADGGECRVVREVAYVKGKEEQQESKYCKGADGGWSAA